MQFTNDDAERMHASHMKKLLQPETAAEEKACESPREELQPEPDPAVTDQSSEAPDLGEGGGGGELISSQHFWPWL